ncbi:MAG: putative DNA binding domain-containing protein [Methanomassiliicoccaceae archaeon]|nr:putative DNA binding domain-containing protein [Methanomassiliicoccaceae archaeon]
MEDEDTEWRPSWSEECLMTIAAFSNGNGGTVTIGIDDKGNVIGADNPQGLLKAIRDAISGNLGIKASVSERLVEGKTCIDIAVERGSCLTDLDGKLYGRMGGVTSIVKGDELQPFVSTRRQTSWTDLPARNIGMGMLSQDAIDLFVKKGLSTGRMSGMAKWSNESLLRRYCLMDDDGIRNSAAILFMEHPAPFFPASTVKIGAFDEDNRLLRRDIIDCPMIAQPDKVMHVLQNKYIFGIDGVELDTRVTRYPCPMRAVREALVNSLVHRDLSSAAGTYIMVYPSHVRINNPGALPLGWTKDDLSREHTSRPANPNIANVFYDAGYLERWGAGTVSMWRECETMGLPPPEYVLSRDQVEVIFRLTENIDEPIPQDGSLDTSEMTETN